MLNNLNSLFLILSTNVKNNFINRGLSSIVNPVSTESKNSLSPARFYHAATQAYWFH